MSFDVVDRIRLIPRANCSCPAGRRRQADAATRATYEEWRKQAEMLLNRAGLTRGRYEAARFSAWDPKRQKADALRVFNAVRDYVDTVADNGPNWLYLHGDYGLGKTHLAVAAVREIAARKLWQPHVIVWPEICQLTKESWGGGGGSTPSEGAMWRSARGAVVLLIDDLDKTDTTNWAMGKLYALINNRYDRQMPTIITANRSIPLMKQLWKKSNDDVVRDTGTAVLSRIGGQLMSSVKFEGEDQRWAEATE